MEFNFLGFLRREKEMCEISDVFKQTIDFIEKGIEKFAYNVLKATTYPTYPVWIVSRLITKTQI